MELKSGEIYRGELHDAEDNWNVQLINVQATARDGKVRRRAQNAAAAPAAARRFCRRQKFSALYTHLVQVSHMEHIFIRGGRVRFVIVPDMLKNAPMVRVPALRQQAGGVQLPCLPVFAWSGPGQQGCNARVALLRHAVSSAFAPHRQQQAALGPPSPYSSNALTPK